MKILIIDTSSNCLDWAMRCQQFGHVVKWYDKPRDNGTPRRAGEGIIEKIRDYDALRKKWIGWADLIYLPDNAHYLDMLEPFRKIGYPIYAPSVEAAELELNRGAGQRAMKAAGIPIMESKTFTDYPAAIKFVQKNPHFLVSKPSGDANKALSYVAHDAADMTYMLERWSKREDLVKAARADGFLLQEKKTGCEMAVGGWFGPGGWSKWFVQNWENKKLMDGDLGVATGEMGCYSEDSEVLTKNGWKLWPDVRHHDELATLVDGRTEFEIPSALVSYDVDTTMVGWKNQTIDVLVTQNHQMYVQSQQSARKGTSGFKFVQARDCTQSQYAVKRTADWIGNDLDTYTIPAYRNKGKITLDAEAWARFIGLYVAEGSCGCSVNIAQSHPEKSKKAEVIIKKTGLPYKRIRNGFNIYRRQIVNHVKPLGRSWEKHVPQWIKDSSPRIITSFLDGYALGDGNMQANGFRVFYTCSKRLADDVQELLLKIGRGGTIIARGPRAVPNKIDGREIKSNRLQYEVCERIKKTRSWLDKRDRYEVPYKGKVYCATVSSHVLFVRRNGKPMWCGNTLVRMVRQCKLAEKVLLPITKTLEELEYVGYIDNNCIIDDKGDPWPMEWTMRDGWPLRHNLTAHIKNADPAQWMLDMLNGHDTIEAVDGEVSISVVMAIPDFPYSKLTNKEVSGIPIYNCEDMEHIHLSEVMMGEAPVLCGDKVVTMPHPVSSGDYILISVGTGETITGARKSAYAAIRKIRMPNSPFYRLDIGRGRMVKQLPEIQKLGFAKGLTF